MSHLQGLHVYEGLAGWGVILCERVIYSNNLPPAWLACGSHELEHIWSAHRTSKHGSRRLIELLKQIRDIVLLLLQPAQTGTLRAFTVSAQDVPEFTPHCALDCNSMRLLLWQEIYSVSTENQSFAAVPT